MLTEASQQLTDDHSALNEVLKQLQESLSAGDVAAIHSHLDLFWARLAVHIRAEHLHLFPCVLTGLSNKTSDPLIAPDLREGQMAVERLRGDHEFFMRELARAISILRELLQTTDRHTIARGLNSVRNAILEIEKRLITHNEIEESQIYRWATVVLNEEEQAALAMRINQELANRPPRFELNSWPGSD